MGGLTCAVALSKYPDVDVDVYEAAATLTANGPGVGVWLRTWRILQQLGLDQELAEIIGIQMSDDPSETHLFYFRFHRPMTHCMSQLLRLIFGKAIVLKAWIFSN